MKAHCVLFVCTGNICRSPTADAVLRHLVRARGWSDLVQVDSAATHAYHVGEPPDARSQQHALRRGYDLSVLRARALQDDDFEHFDLVVAMDHGHMLILRERCPAHLQSRLHYFTNFCSGSSGRDVPDPYYGSAKDFEKVLDLVEDGCEGIARQLLHS